MSIDLSAIHLSTLAWLGVLAVIVLIVFGIFRFFLRGLMHLFFRGCGLILIVAAILYILHVLKLI
jgi:hypothetical protein